MLIYGNCVILQINKRSKHHGGSVLQIPAKKHCIWKCFSTMSLVEKYSDWESILYLAICICNQIVTVTFLYEINIMECICLESKKKTTNVLLYGHKGIGVVFLLQNCIGLGHTF